MKKYLIGLFLVLSFTEAIAGNAVFIRPDTSVSSPTTWLDDICTVYGSSNDASICWNTTQTVDGWYFGTATGQNTIVIAEEGDKSFDFAHGAQTNPTLFIHSANQSTTQHLNLKHDATDGTMSVGTGGIKLLASDGSSYTRFTAGLQQWIGAITGTFNIQLLDTVGLKMTSKLTNSTSVPAYDFYNEPNTAANSFNASSGTQIHTKIRGTQNQTGTAAIDMLSIELTQTAEGSGEDTLINAKVGGTSKFKANASGDIVFAGKRVNTSQSISIADNGGGTAAAYTLTPTSSFVELRCNDADGCDITMDETGATAGQFLTVINVFSNTLNFADTAGVSELTGAFAMGTSDTLSMVYSTSAWNEVSRSNN